MTLAVDPQLDLWQSLYPSLVTLPLYLQELTEAVRRLRPDVQVDTSRLELVVAEMAAVVRELRDTGDARSELSLDWEPLAERLEKVMKAAKGTGGPIMSAAHSSGVILTDRVGTQLLLNSDGSIAASFTDLQKGTWAYHAGASGTLNVPAGERVLGIVAHATGAGASMTINGGDSIPIPANVGIELEPRGNLTAPTIVFTSTDTYVVETVH